MVPDRSPSLATGNPGGGFPEALSHCHWALATNFQVIVAFLPAFTVSSPVVFVVITVCLISILLIYCHLPRKVLRNVNKARATSMSPNALSCELRHRPIHRIARGALPAFGIAGGDGDLHGAGREVVVGRFAFGHDLVLQFHGRVGEVGDDDAITDGA
jgi:hypothetical protein